MGIYLFMSNERKYSHFEIFETNSRGQIQCQNEKIKVFEHPWLGQTYLWVNIPCMKWQWHHDWHLVDDEVSR